MRLLGLKLLCLPNWLMVTNYNQTPVYSYRPRKTQTSDGACSTRNEKPRINIIEKNTKIIVIALELCGFAYTCCLGMFSLFYIYWDWRTLFTQVLNSQIQIVIKLNFMRKSKSINEMNYYWHNIFNIFFCIREIG